MKLTSNHPSRRPPIRLMSNRAFTLTEMMVTLAVFSLVVTAMVSLQIFGFKINSFTSTKMRFTSGSLKALDQVRNQIRSATNIVLIGNFNTGNNTFTAIAAGNPAIGNAAQISNNPASLVTFYLNTSTQALYENTNNSQVMSLASHVINSQPFQAEDCFGNVAAVDSSGNYTIKMTLLFSNVDYSVPTNAYDTYRIESRATPRTQFDLN